MEALLYFAVWAAFIFLMMRFGCGAHVMGHGHRETKKHGRGDQHVYVRLARQEEREVRTEFDDAYARYAAGVSAFIPRLGRPSENSI